MSDQYPTTTALVAALNEPEATVEKVAAGMTPEEAAMALKELGQLVDGVMRAVSTIAEGIVVTFNQLADLLTPAKKLCGSTAHGWSDTEHLCTLSAGHPGFHIEEPARGSGAIPRSWLTR